MLKDIFKKLFLCLLLEYRNDLFLYIETGNYILIKLTYAIIYFWNFYKYNQIISRESESLFLSYFSCLIY